MLDIKELIENPDKLNKETLPQLKELTEKYPFFQVARILYVRNLFLQHSPQFGTELRKASAFVPDRSTLFAFTEGEHYQIESAGVTQPEIRTESDSNRTISLIDTFLKQSKSDTQRPTIADLTNDYASFLMKSEEQEQDVAIEDAETKMSPQLRGAHLIDSFIQETKGKQRVQMKSLEEEEVGSYFESPEISNEEEEIYTENMVNIYIKQGRYEQAYEILSKICLNNPKKSSIFATQMNLLEVIISGKQQ